MYYSKIFGVKLQKVSLIKLYSYGDECTAITGGWVGVGSGIVKNADNITINHANRNGRVVKTVNTVDVPISRIFVRLKTNENNNSISYGFDFGSINTDTDTMVTILYNFITKNDSYVSQRYFTPNIDKVIEYNVNSGFNKQVAFINNWGIWNIYEIWAETYDN